MTVNLKAYDVFDTVTLHVGRFEDVGRLWADGIFDFAFVDGSHDAEAVSRDLRIVKRLMRSGGSVALHDWYYEGVKRAALDVLGWEDGPSLVDTLQCRKIGD